MIRLKEQRLLYSVCRYIPDLMRGESINVGIAIHNFSSSEVIFRQSKHFSRIKAFDDEVDIEVLKALLESISIQFSTEYLLENEQALDSELLLKEETSHFVNQIQFDEIKTLISDNVENDIQDLIDIYLYYEKKKSDRITRDKVRSLASRIVADSRLKKNINKHPRIKNMFYQTPVDFSLELYNEEVYFKALTFDYKDKNKFIKELKNLLFDVNDLKNFKIKVVINNAEAEEDYEKLALKALKEKNVDVYTLNQFRNFVDSSEATGQMKLFN